VIEVAKKNLQLIKLIHFRAMTDKQFHNLKIASQGGEMQRSDCVDVHAIGTTAVLEKVGHNVTTRELSSEVESGAINANQTFRAFTAWTFAPLARQHWTMSLIPLRTARWRTLDLSSVVVAIDPP
jgi:hypothetical protein